MHNDPNTLRILFATDNHLGYLEKDPIRAEDSFRAFEEIIQLAKTKKVDFLLLGGDLFHENKPSRKCIYKAMEMFRLNCFGERQCEFEIVSDQSKHFHSSVAMANICDPFLNVELPAFIVHGNHDDPTGDGNYSAVDLLDISGAINYFGKVSDYDNVDVQPILLRKGTTNLALYGLGNIRDERLHRAFVSDKVLFKTPDQDSRDWFNLFVIHQNRFEHGGPKNYIPERFLPNFLDLVLWGHEHECLVDPVHNPEREFYVCQPGSSVVTSLMEGEAKPKHVALITVNGKDFNLEKIPLKSTRPFEIDEVILSQVPHLAKDTKSIEKFLSQKITDMIETARSKWEQSHDHGSQFLLPLIRIRAEYSGDFLIPNPQRLGQKFVNKVANPKDVVYFYRKRQSAISRDKKPVIEVNSNMEKNDIISMDDLVTEYLSAQKLDIIPERQLMEAVRAFVEKDEKDAVKEFLTRNMKKTQKKIVSLAAENPIENLLENINKFKILEQVNGEEEDVASARPVQSAETSASLRPPPRKGVSEMEFTDSESEEVPPPHKATKEPRAKSAAGRRTKKKSVPDSDESDYSEESATAPASKGSRARVTASRANQKNTVSISDDSDYSDEPAPSRKAVKKAPAKQAEDSEEEILNDPFESQTFEKEKETEIILSDAETISLDGSEIEPPTKRRKAAATSTTKVSAAKKTTAAKPATSKAASTSAWPPRRKAK